MDKKIIIIGGAIVVGLGVLAVFFFGGFTKVSEEDGVVIVEKDKIVTETVTFISEDLTYEITKNKVTKNASIEIEYPITDDIEYSDFMGSEITMVPFTVNLTCGMFNSAFLDPDSLGLDDEDSEPVTEDSEFADILTGYEIVEFQINFQDKEDGGKIAICQSEDKNIEKMTFETFRDYSDVGSFFGTEIGVFQEDEEGL